jgi:hypothetical protein
MAELKQTKVLEDKPQGFQVIVDVICNYDAELLVPG